MRRWMPGCRSPDDVTLDRPRDDCRARNSCDESLVYRRCVHHGHMAEGRLSRERRSRLEAAREALEGLDDACSRLGRELDEQWQPGGGRCRHSPAADGGGRARREASCSSGGRARGYGSRSTALGRGASHAKLVQDFLPQGRTSAARSATAPPQCALRAAGLLHLLDVPRRQCCCHHTDQRDACDHEADAVEPAFGSGRESVAIADGGHGGRGPPEASPKDGYWPLRSSARRRGRRVRRPSRTTAMAAATDPTTFPACEPPTSATETLIATRTRSARSGRSIGTTDVTTSSQLWRRNNHRRSASRT